MDERLLAAAAAAAATVALLGRARVRAEHHRAQSAAAVAAARTRPAAAADGPTRTVWTVATFNVRGFFDHYARRRRLLRSTVRAIKPDILALQEVMVNGADQDRFITRALNTDGRPPFRCLSETSILAYLRSVGTPKMFGKILGPVIHFAIELENALLQLPFVGSIMARFPHFLERVRHWVHDWTGIDIFWSYYMLYAPIWGMSTIVAPELEVLERGAIPLRTDIYDKHLTTTQRVKLRFPCGRTIWLVNMHLDSTTAPQGAEIRAREVHLILDWMRPVLDEADATFAVGDNNTLLEKEHIFDLWRDAGFVSAHEAVHGSNPDKTWPSGIACSPFIDTDGEPGCLDYIWVHGSSSIKFHDAGVGGDASCEMDEQLYASDHLAVFATFSFP